MTTEDRIVTNLLNFLMVNIVIGDVGSTDSSFNFGGLQESVAFDKKCACNKPLFFYPKDERDFLYLISLVVCNL